MLVSVLEQLQVVEKMLDAPTSTLILNGEGENLDKLFTNLLEAVTKGSELSEDESDSRHDRALHDFDKQLFTMKQRIVEALQSNTGERVPAQTEEKTREVQHHDEFHKSVSECGSISLYSHTSRSSVKQQAINCWTRSRAQSFGRRPES